MTTPPGPLRAVLDAFGSGAASLDDVARTTALPRDVVDASVAHLVRMGWLSAAELAAGCPAGRRAGCGGCVGSVGGCSLVSLSVVRRPG